MRIRATPIGSDGRLWLDPGDIYLHNPLGDPMRRWPMRNAAHGPIEVEYPLGDPTLTGQWTVVASARGSSSRAKFTKKIQVVDYRYTGISKR